MASGVTLLDKKKREKLREDLQIKKTIGDVREERQLRWFGHVSRRGEDDLVQEAIKIPSQVNHRQRGRRKSNWNCQMKEELRKYDIAEEVTQNRIEYRARLRFRTVIVPSQL